MEILKDKKVLIGVAVLALAGYWYWYKNKSKTTAIISNKYNEEEISKKAKDLFNDTSNTLDSMLPEYGNETNVQFIVDLTNSSSQIAPLKKNINGRTFSQAVSEFKNIYLVPSYNLINSMFNKLNKSDVDKAIPIFKKISISGVIKSFPKISKDLYSKYELTTDEKLNLVDLQTKTGLDYGN
jgi:hypothetical protein